MYWIKTIGLKASLKSFGLEAYYILLSTELNWCWSKTTKLVAQRKMKWASLTKRRVYIHTTIYDNQWIACVGEIAAYCQKLLSSEFPKMAAQGNKPTILWSFSLTAFSKAANLWHLKNFCYILSADIIPFHDEATCSEFTIYQVLTDTPNIHEH